MRVNQRVTTTGLYNFEIGEHGDDHGKDWVGFRHGGQFAGSWAAGRTDACCDSVESILHMG